LPEKTALGLLEEQVIHVKKLAVGVFLEPIIIHAYQTALENLVLGAIAAIVLEEEARIVGTYQIKLHAKAQQDALGDNARKKDAGVII